MVESAAAPEADGYERRGKVFCLRLTDEEREQLRQLYQGEARDLIPWHSRSLGRFMVWAALQWTAKQQALPNGRAADGTVRRNGQVVARRVKPKRPGRGNTVRPGRRRAKGKKRR